MNKTKKIIILLLLLLVVLLVVVVTLMLNLEDENTTDYNDNTEFEQQDIYVPSENIGKETNRNKYYAVSNIVDDYMNILDDLKDGSEESIQSMYNILDKEYIEEFNITTTNIAEKFNLYDANEKAYIDDMYEIEMSASINFYLIYGTTIYGGESFELIVKTDSANSTFSIFPEEYLEAHNYSYENSKEDFNISINDIEENNDNIYEYENVSDYQMVIYYFEDIINKVYEDNGLYNILNEEYRNIKFENIDNFNTYLNELKENQVELRSITNYQINNYDDYTQYILIDDLNNYYIINETAVMEYTVILDTYTIDLPQFTEQYNNATDAEKVLLNIQKVFAAIDDGDYKYVYNKLDSTFRQNNFPTEEEFETYITQNFYENNSVTASNYQTSGNLHIYEVEIENEDDETSSIVTKNFIMQLLEGTDFVMSFNV